VPSEGKRPPGLKKNQWEVLRIIRLNPGKSIREIAALGDFSVNGLSQTIPVLASRSLVKMDLNWSPSHPRRNSDHYLDRPMSAT
jgi:predicted transcriptional regulator